MYLYSKKIFVILKIHPTLRSTLFPYTTLFRSRRSVPKETGDRSRSGAEFDRFGSLRSAMIAVIDRKSTRLNSSHVSISYAVFCLKKIKIIIRVNEISENVKYRRKEYLYHCALC